MVNMGQLKRGKNPMWSDRSLDVNPAGLEVSLSGWTRVLGSLVLLFLPPRGEQARWRGPHARTGIPGWRSCGGPEISGPAGAGDVCHHEKRRTRKFFYWKMKLRRKGKNRQYLMNFCINAWSNGFRVHLFWMEKKKKHSQSTGSK